MPKVTVFYGFYGSGKSEIALNYAVYSAAKGKLVTIVDLDAVTPYFRVRDYREELARLTDRVAVISPKETVRHADLPVLPEGVRAVLSGGMRDVIVDVGGDPTGARVLGGLKDALSSSAEGLFVLNSSRPFTRTVEDAKRAVEAIAVSSGLAPTGLVSNTHMGDQTAPSHIVGGCGFAREVGRSLGLPVCFCAAPENLRSAEKLIVAGVGALPILWLRRFLKKPWERQE